MMIIDFALKGPPFSVNARHKGKKQNKNYRQWIEAVRMAAAPALHSEHLLIARDAQVYLAFYYSQIMMDIDNPVKPILDALGAKALETVSYPALVWEDDVVVNRLLVERFRSSDSIDNPQPKLAEALDKYDDVVYVRVEWEEM